MGGVSLDLKSLEPPTGRVREWLFDRPEEVVRHAGPHAADHAGDRRIRGGR